MKKLILPIVVVFLSLLLTQPVNSAANVDTIINLEFDLDKSDEVSVTHSFLVVGTSDQTLTYQTHIVIPYSNFKINKVTQGGRSANYSQTGSTIYINLNKLLKKDEQTLVVLEYTTTELIQTQLDFKILTLTSPIQNNYRLIINDKTQGMNNVFNNLSFQNSSTITNKNYIGIWEVVDQDTFSGILKYSDLTPNSLVPIFSENTGYKQKVDFIEGSNEGYVDEAGNFFLVSEGNELTVRSKFQKDSSLLDSKPFLNYATFCPNNLIELEKLIHNKTINQTIGNHPDVTKDSLSSLEFALLTSSCLTKLNFNNQLNYGFVYHPFIGMFLHFWVEYDNDGISEIWDSYLVKLLGSEYSIYPVRFKFGILNDHNLSPATILATLNLEDASLEFFKDDFTTDFAVNPNLISINLLRNNTAEYLNISNDSQFFGFIKSSSDSILYEQLANILLLPETTFTFPVKIEHSSKDYTSSLEVITIDEVVNIHLYNTQTFDLSPFYLRIALFIFASSALIMILILSIKKLKSKSKPQKKVKTKHRLKF